MAGVERSLAVLIADVVGSHKLLERLGKDETARAVDRVIKRMDRAISGYNGRLVRAKGDRIVVAFPGATEACHAATEMQHRVRDLPAVSFVKLAIRIGFHFGSVLETADDLVGDAATIAARIAGLAAADQILTSQATVAQLSPQFQELIAPSDLPGFPGVEIRELVWKGASPEELALRISSVQPVFPVMALLLDHKGQQFRVDADNPTATFGRDPSNLVVVDDRKASRHHARIERRGDYYYLIDESTNGTYVRLGEYEQVVRKQEFRLEGEGLLGCGSSLAEGATDLVKFSHL